MDIRLCHQRQLILACLDDFTPNSTLQDYVGGQFGNDTHLWRSAVIDFIYQNMKRDLIMVLPCQQQYSEKNCNEIKELLLNGDRDNGIELLVVWNILYFQGTEKLKKITNHFCLDNWNSLYVELNEDLLNAINNI
ncbi:MAG: hypothetical protein WCC64_14130 [Aliidongia sp.]